MPETQLTNPAGAFGGAPTLGFSWESMINGSSSTVLANSVVISSSSQSGLLSVSTLAAAFTTVISASVTSPNSRVLGVLHNDTVAGAIGMVVTSGPHLIAVSTGGTLPVFGDVLIPSTSCTQGAATGTPVLCPVKAVTQSTALAGSVIGTMLSTGADANFVSNSTGAETHQMANVGVF